MNAAMRFFTPQSRRSLMLALVAITVAHVADPWAWQWLRALRINETDAGRMLRSLGYLPTWLAIGGALWFQHRGTLGGARPAVYVVMSATMGGLLAEVLKLLLRRERPALDLFAYSFRAYTEDPFSTRGLGLPSSHVLVAFAGAAAISTLYPRTRPVWLVLAAGCALTRILAVGHFLSDTVVAAILGVAVAAVCTRWVAPRPTQPAKTFS
jgi:membrane-associated phospholipid phosphatase